MATDYVMYNSFVSPAQASSVSIGNVASNNTIWTTIGAGGSGGSGWTIQAPWAGNYFSFDTVSGKVMDKVSEWDSDTNE